MTLPLFLACIALAGAAGLVTCKTAIQAWGLWRRQNPGAPLWPIAAETLLIAGLIAATLVFAGAGA